MKRKSFSADMMFDWSRERHAPLLPALVMGAASLALHALSFYFVQIVYPNSTILRPPTAVLNLQTAEINAGLYTWLSGQNPALLASWSLSQMRPPIDLLPGANQLHTYQGKPVQTLPAPSATATINLPDALPTRLPYPTDSVAVAAVPPTDLMGSPTLAYRIIEANSNEAWILWREVTPDFIEAALPWELPRAIVCVDAPGRIAHVFITRSTGDHALDSSYARALDSTPSHGLKAGWHQLEFGWRLDPQKPSSHRPESPATQP